MAEIDSLDVQDLKRALDSVSTAIRDVGSAIGAELENIDASLAIMNDLLERVNGQMESDGVPES